MSLWSGNAPDLRTITIRCNQAAAEFFLMATPSSSSLIALEFRTQSKKAMVLRDGHSTGCSAKKANACVGKAGIPTRTRVSNADNCDNGQDRSE